jgi:hypothetical protein
MVIAKGIGMLHIIIVKGAEIQYNTNKDSQTFMITAAGLKFIFDVESAGIWSRKTRLRQ